MPLRPFNILTTPGLLVSQASPGGHPVRHAVNALMPRTWLSSAFEARGDVEVGIHVDHTVLAERHDPS
jgi:hypothetical protein